MEIGVRDLVAESGHQAGRTLLQEMYRARFGTDMPEILISDLGKPYFRDLPIHFSISHTKGHVFCVLSDCPVGIDAEEIHRDIRLTLADKILSPREKAAYEKAADKRETLLRFWVLKEAQAKCQGTGLQGYPNHTDFSPNDPRILEMNGCFVAVITE